MKEVAIDRHLVPPKTSSAACAPDHQPEGSPDVPMMERADVGWWEGESFRSEPGRLLEISARGAALAVGDSPAVGQAVWLCVIGPNRTGWVAARVLHRRDGVSRIAFTEGFPYDLFKSVVWGVAARDRTPATAFEAEVENDGARCNPPAPMSADPQDGF